MGIKIFLGLILLIAIIYFIFYLQNQLNPNKSCSEKCSSCQFKDKNECFFNKDNQQ